MIQIQLTDSDLEIINNVVKENSLKTFTIVQDSSSGIGSTTTIKFPADLRGRNVSISVSVSGEEDW